VAYNNENKSETLKKGENDVGDTLWRRREFVCSGDERWSSLFGRRTELLANIRRSRVSVRRPMRVHAVQWRNVYGQRWYVALPVVHPVPKGIDTRSMTK